MTGGGRGRERWEKHKQFTLALVSVSEARGQHTGDDGGGGEVKLRKPPHC